jgi:predicted glycosyltransferase involved in capsule biosynthesis
MGVGPHPDEQFPGWREGLETLRAEIENLQAQVRELEPRRDRSRQYDENRARQRSAAHDVISEIAQMPSFNR